MRLRCKKALVVFIEATVRTYQPSDLSQLIQVYKSAFAEPPWNEYMKCIACSVEYGRQEVTGLCERKICKKCNQPLKLVEFWSEADITNDLGFALTQPNSIVLVAENNDKLAGMTWGYRLPFDKFPFLDGKVSVESSYMDEISVRGDIRLKGIGTLLGRAYIETVRQQGLFEVVLRTDERNTSSMSLFKKLGFSGIPSTEDQRSIIYDPQFLNRVYLRMKV